MHFIAAAPAAGVHRLLHYFDACKGRCKNEIKEESHVPTSRKR